MTAGRAATDEHSHLFASRTHTNPVSVHGAVFVLLLSCKHRYLMTKGVKQATFTSKSSRHGLMVLMFMVAGMVSRRQPDSTEPLDLGRKRMRQASPQGRSQRPRRRACASSSDLAAGGRMSSWATPLCSSGSSSCASSNASQDAATIRSDDAFSDAGTDSTMSAGEEAEDAAPAPELVTTSAEYTAVFGSKPTRDAVLGIVCRDAAIMATLCGKNKEEGYRMTEAEAKALSKEVFEFVTKYVVALFGAVHTTKFHALAYHLLPERLLRGNVVEADTSLNKALHKLVKNMWDRTNKQPASVLLQMLRAEQTLAHITETDAFDFQQAGGGGRSEVGQGVMGDQADAGTSTLRSGAVAAAGNGGNVDDGVNADENDNGCNPDASPQGPEYNFLRVFDEVAGTGAFEAMPDEAPSEHDKEIELEDDLVSTLRSRQSHRRVRISGRRVTVAQAVAAEDGRLQQLPNLLKSHPVALRCSAASQLIVTNTFKFDARLEWRTRPVRQLLRATEDLYRKPWWYYVLYEAPGAPAGAKPHLGLARLLVRAVDGRRCDIVVVQRLEDAIARLGFVLTSFNC